MAMDTMVVVTVEVVVSLVAVAGEAVVSIAGRRAPSLVLLLHHH